MSKKSYLDGSPDTFTMREFFEMRDADSVESMRGDDYDVWSFLKKKEKDNGTEE